MTDDPNVIDLKDTLDHQRADDEAPQRFKVLRWGRRRGKSVFEIKASIAGHGPIGPNGVPRFPGVMHGHAVGWLAPDFQQAKNLWNAEIRPRFDGKRGVRITHTPPYELELIGTDGKVFGGLYLFSMENVRAMRGLGNRLIGVCIDEAAWLDLAYAWADVIRPILMDNQGWAIIASTTNAGLDGNQEKKVPSFFNQLCLDIMAGTRDPAEWLHSHGTARDNPKISPEEFEKTRAEVALKGAVAVAQEMEAELLTAGAGIAFTEWAPTIHVLPAGTAVPVSWRWFAGLDWGYNDPGCITLLAAGPEREVVVRADWVFQQMTAYRVGYEAGVFFARHGVPETIAYDSSMDDTYKLGGPAASAELLRGLRDVLKDQAPLLIPTVKEGRGGKSYRQVRKLVLHEMLAYQTPPESRDLEPWERPRLTFHPDAAYCIRTIPVLPLDPKDIEDVDTTAQDHGYDSLTYALMGQIPRPASDREMRQPHQHIFRGIDPETGRERPLPWEREPEKARFRTAFRFKRG